LVCVIVKRCNYLQVSGNLCERDAWSWPALLSPTAQKQGSVISIATSNAQPPFSGTYHDTRLRTWPKIQLYQGWTTDVWHCVLSLLSKAFKIKLQLRNEHLAVVYRETGRSRRKTVFPSGLEWCLEKTILIHSLYFKSSPADNMKETDRPDDGGSTYLWNVGPLLRNYRLPYPRRPYSPSWEPKICVRDEAPTLGPRVWQCAAWPELLHTYWGGDRWVCSNGGMMTSRRKTEEFGEKRVPVPLCLPQIPHGLARARTRASVVRGQRLTS
jgi:hypothetical protein